MVDKQGEASMIATTERKQYEAVAKMTGLELAKIEADELHPLYAIVCEEIDARSASNGKRHALDRFDEEDAWDRSFMERQARSLDPLDDELFDSDDVFVAAAGFVDPAEYTERFVDMFEHAYA
jgi:hypothetical protein